jgi:hypothetical protein
MRAGIYLVLSYFSCFDIVQPKVILHYLSPHVYLDAKMELSDDLHRSDVLV